MEKYKTKIRTTLSQALSSATCPDYGVYILACYPSLGCLYIGISENVDRRIREHVAGDRPLGEFLRSTMADSVGFRLDVLTPPDTVDPQAWCEQVEHELIAQFRPTFNTRT